jgi:WD40 repeat protein
VRPVGGGNHGIPSSSGTPCGRTRQVQADCAFKCYVSTPADRLLVASGSKDKAVRVWDAATGRRVGDLLTGHRERVRSVALCVSPTDSQLVVASGSDDRTVRLWDAASGCPMGEPLTGHSGRVASVALCASRPSVGL